MTTSVDPLYTAALAQAKAAFNAETAPIQGEQAASDAQFQSRQTDATNNAAAVSSLLSGIGPAVNGEYQTGAQNVELAANGFSHGMQDALQGNTDNLNAMLAKLGSPAQLGSHASQAGDVLYALHGYNPGTTFSKQGANFGAAADLQAGTALLKGQENVKELQGKAIVADQGFQAKIAEMAGKLPGDTQTNYQHLQTLALNDAKFREQVRKDNIDQAYKGATLKLALAKYSTSVSEFNARQSQQLQIASARLAQQKYISDRSYAISLSKLGIEQVRLQQTIVANSFKAANGGLTPAQVAKFSSSAEAIALKAYLGTTKVTVVNGKPVQTPNVGSGISYAEALQRELQTGMPVQIALDALDRIYPADQRPTDAILAQELGALDPSLVQSVAAEAKATQTAVNAMTTDPVAALAPGAASKWVVVAPNANRPGANLNPKVIDFVGNLGHAYGHKLTIGTGTNHNQFVVGTDRQSAHWVGNAADVPASGATLTTLGQDALILAGMPPAQARQQQGGLFNIGGYQIIFNSMEGGNHYNHLHVGLN